MSNTANKAKLTLLALLGVLIVGCSGGSSGTTPTAPDTGDTSDDTSSDSSTPVNPPAPPAPPPTYSLSGTVTGLLASADTFVVLDAGVTPAITVRIEGDGAFVFPAEVEDGTAYNVTVADAQTPAPNALVCAVSGGQGTVNDADVTGIDVQCEVVGPDDSRSLPAEAQFAADLFALGQIGLFTEIAASTFADEDAFFASTIEALGSPMETVKSFNCNNGGTMVVSRWIDGALSFQDGLFNRTDLVQEVAFTDCDMDGAPDLALTSVVVPFSYYPPSVRRALGVALSGPFIIGKYAGIPMSYMVDSPMSSSGPSITFTRGPGMSGLPWVFDAQGEILLQTRDATMTYTDESSSTSGHEEVDFTIAFGIPNDRTVPAPVAVVAADLTTPVTVELDGNGYLVGGEILVVDHRGTTSMAIRITPNADPVLVNLSLDAGGDGSYEVVDQPIRWDAFIDDQILVRFANRGGFSN